MIFGLYFLGWSFILLSYVWIIRICFSYFTIIRTRAEFTHKPNLGEGHINIILPVLNEDERMRQFVYYFKNMLLPACSNITLWIVSTEKEVSQYPHSPTIKLAKSMAANSKYINHLHYPFTNGVMAHQLNYALEHTKQKGMYAIYNADSRPDPRTFPWIIQNYNPNINQVFQQYGIYTKNLNFIKNRKWHSILIANAFWQCRWSLGFEYYKAESAILKRKWPHAFRPFNYTVGHGLFVSSRLLKEVKFSEKTVNEDAIFGLEIDSRKIILQPIPYFDLADTPDSVKTIWIQKTNWFQGPFQSKIYRRVILEKKLSDSFHLTISSVKLFTHAVYWLIGPLATVLVILASLLLGEHNNILILFIIAPLIFLILPNIVANIVMLKLHNDQNNFLNNEYKIKTPVLITYLAIGALPAYWIHGFSAFRGIFLSKRIASGTKLKTPMAQYGD